jgi:alpha-mannosidase
MPNGLLIEKLKRRLRSLESKIYRRVRPMPPLQFRLGDTNAWTTLQPGSQWGRLRESFEMQGQFSVPPDFSAPALWLPIGQGGDFEHPEALLYLDATAFAGVDRHHHEIKLPKSLADDKPHSLLLKGWCGIRPETFLIGQPAVVDVDAATRQLGARAQVGLDAVQWLGDRDPLGPQLLTALDEALTHLDWRGQSFYESVAEALGALEEALRQIGSPLPVEIVATGHAHIDVAWLWTLSQTRQKAARSFSTVLRLMDEFPDYHFTQSQPQLYAFIKEDQPELFNQIQRRVAEGRWEPTGGMWLEADCNLTGAESLARQFLLGRRFFREHFQGVDTPILWLPDAFGFNWALPQLIRQAGLEYFLTVKLSWNQTNRFPFDSFWWQGLDGTRVLAHTPTTPDSWSMSPGKTLYTYNGQLEVDKMMGAWEHYRHKDVNRSLLSVFGYGDGGGGPNREMLLAGAAQRSHPGLPQVRPGSALEFFNHLRDTAGDRLPVWNGELYLEYHRGTYTSQAAVKRANRKNEVALHAAEFLAAWAVIRQRAYAYPRAELTRAWELLCLNQFHDILPGSSIGEVYVESRQQHAEIARVAGQVQTAALEAFAAEGGLLVFNPTSFARREPVFISEAALANGQAVEGGTLMEAGEIPPYGYVALNPESLSLPANSLSAAQTTGGWVLENEYLRVVFDQAGELTSVWDKEAAREVLAGKGNQLQAFDDRPLNFDAWDIDSFFEDQMWLADPTASISVVEEGPLRAAIEVRRRVLNSEVTQRVYLWRGGRRLDFETRVEWRERQTLLKVAFPVTVLSPQATYEIQWGNLERPTHRNTSWDAARFEVPAHKWADLSEGDYGVSLLNDCKYGYDIRDNVMRLTLIKSAIDPDPNADLGQHIFTYSLLPHRGDWRGHTSSEAYALNYPLLAFVSAADQRHRPMTPSSASPASLVAVDASHVIVETVKAAEDGDGVIVRLYESQRRRGQVTLRTGFDLKAAWRTNLLEENEAALTTDGRAISLVVRPYEIVTLRLSTR